MKLKSLLFIMLACLLMGCGGGGGLNTSFNVIADWSGVTSASGGQSIRVAVYGPTGALSGSTIINFTGTNQTSSPITGLTAGANHLQAQLFSQSNAQGTQTGSLDIQFDPSQIHSETLSVAGNVAGIKVTPSSAVVSVQQTQDFFASGTTSSNELTFLAANTISWTQLGNVGTIDPATGLFTGTSAGSGSVRATYSPSGAVAGATVTVNPISVTQGTWTILVYMNAANDLSQYSLTNFEQMQQAAGNPKVRIIVQWKQVPSLGYPTSFDGTRRYLVQQSNANSLASSLVQDLGQGVDMGSYQTLNQFINWGTTYYPAQHYALVIWDHGNGWNRSMNAAASRAVSYDDQTGDAIQTWQLSQALGNVHFDILAWDASLMQMCEVSDEIRNNVTYICGSEASPPGAGYPYNLIFQNFTNNPTASPLTLAKGFVTGMIQGYASDPTDEITQSVIDTSQLPALNTAITNLQVALLGALGPQNFATAIQTARNNAQTYSQTTIRYYRDLYDLTSQLDASGAMPTSVLNADAAVRSAIGNAVVDEGHNAAAPGSHGISIDFSPSSVFASEVSDYSQLRFNNDTQWGHYYERFGLQWRSFADRVHQAEQLVSW